MMNRLSSYIYHTVHTNGLLADMVYSTSHHLRGAWMHLRNWRASSSKATPEEVWHLRHLLPSTVLILGVTNICNAKCSFCAYPKAVQSKNLQGGVMPFDIFKKAVDEWASLGGENIDLTHTVGDPLVDPGILDKIDYARNVAGIKNISLTTNGILLNRNDTYKRLIDLGVSAVYISTQGTSREMYEKVYGVDHYEEAMSGIRNLLEYNRSKGEPTAIVTRFRNAEKPSEIIRSKEFNETFKPYLSQKVRHNFTVDFDNWGGLIKDSDAFGAMKLRKPSPKVNVPCIALFGYLVRYDGSVRLCGCRFKRSDMDDMVVGNLRRQSLMEISQGGNAWKIIKGFYNGERPETCHGCTLYTPLSRKWLQSRSNDFEAYKKVRPLTAASSTATENNLPPVPEAVHSN